MMTKKYKILGKYIKDLSSETKDIETYLFVKENISKYQLGIDITSQALKNKMIEVNTTLKFEDKEESKKKAYFEIVFSTIVKVNDDVKEKEEMQEIILSDVHICIRISLSCISTFNTTILCREWTGNCCPVSHVYIKQFLCISQP